RPLAHPPALGAYRADEPLRDIIAGQASRGSDQDTFEGRQGGPSPETIAPGALEGSPAIAVLTLEVRFGDLPLGVGRRGGAEARQVLVHRLRLVLTAPRDPDAGTDFQERPPAYAP